jgi:hypothetical protein
MPTANTKYITIYTHGHITGFLAECPKKFKIVGAPDWISINSIYELRIAVPDKINKVGDYTFTISGWEVNLTVKPYCKKRNLKNLESSYGKEINLDDKLEIKLSFVKDDDKKSYGNVCSRSKPELWFAPRFVKFNDDMDKIIVWPIR